MLANQQLTLRAAVTAITGREPTDVEVDASNALSATRSTWCSPRTAVDNETYRAWAADTVVRLLAPSPDRARED